MPFNGHDCAIIRFEHGIPDAPVPLLQIDYISFETASEPLATRGDPGARKCKYFQIERLCHSMPSCV
jgi:hypothetical protein